MMMMMIASQIIEHYDQTAFIKLLSEKLNSTIQVGRKHIKFSIFSQYYIQKQCKCYVKIAGKTEGIKIMKKLEMIVSLF